MMQAFSGTILEPDQDVALPSVARIDGENLILFSSQGTVGKWPLHSIEITLAGNDCFEVITEQRRLSLALDEPGAFQEAIEARGFATGPARDRASPPDEYDRPNWLSRLLLEHPRHGSASIRPFPLGIVIAIVLMVGYLLGTAMGDLIDLVTTESGESPDTPAADVLVRSFQGSGDEATPPFAVVAPWQVAWSVEGPDGSVLEVTLIDDNDERTDLGTEDAPGEGRATLEQSGMFSLEIRSVADATWTVRVLEITNPDGT